MHDKDAELYERVVSIERDAKSVLTYTAGAFPYYTPHDFTHSLNVEENLNWLIPDDVKVGMNEFETFFLIIAAWLHDWGMVCKPGEKPEDVRPFHHLRTEQNFEAMYNLLRLNEHEARIIGRIARGHRVDDLRGSLFERRIYGADVHIDVRFLSAILRLADECDITHNRVPELVYFSLSPIGASEDHFRSHLSIGGIGKFLEHKIEFHAVARDPKGSQTLYRIRDKIQREVDQVKGILAEHKIPIELVEVHVDARGFVDKPISFRLDEEKITKLLVGKALYSRNDVSVRELLQNAVDACRLRQAVNPQASVAIRIYRENDRIVVEDNGVGMDYEIAIKFLANKGFSYYDSEEFEKLGELSFDPVSRWGLGFLSCFLIASKVAIETRKEGKDACRFIIASVGEGWRYEHGYRKEPGTTVSLFLNAEGQKIDLEQTIRHYIKASTVPIYVGKDSTVPSNFHWTLDDEEVQRELRSQHGTIPLAYDLAKYYEDEDIALRYYKSKSVLSGFVQVANQGFFVESLERLLPVPSNSIFLLNAKRNVLELTISREKIITHDAKFEAFKNKWIQVMIRFLEEESKPTSNAKTLVQEVLSYHRLARSYGLLVYYDLGPKFESLSESHREFLLKRLPNLVLINEGLKSWSLEKIQSMKPTEVKLIYLMGLRSEHDTEVNFVQTQMGAKLQSTEIVLFDLDPTSYRFDFEVGDDKRGIYDVLLRDGIGITPTRVLFVSDLIETESQVVDTSLDALLPPGSRFRTLPDLFRGLVLCRLPYFLVVKGSKKDSREYESPLRIILGLGKEDWQKYFEVASMGYLIFDADDEFNRILISKTDRINSDIFLRRLVKDYFALLAYANLGNDDARSSATIFLQKIETEIASRLLESQASFVTGPESRWTELYWAKTHIGPSPVRLVTK